jgi:hypothetical protein
VSGPPYLVRRNPGNPEIAEILDDRGQWIVGRRVGFTHERLGDGVAMVRRVAACLNALDGVPTELIESPGFRDILEAGGAFPPGGGW